MAEMERILLGHGSGGRMMHELVSEHFGPAFGITGVSDAALLDLATEGEGGSALKAGERLALSTDSYVVSPLFFPGGNIGDLAVNGTVNDLAMVGARPVALSAGFIIEEGLEFRKLKDIIASMAAAAEKAGVRIVAGDTKVVERGKADGVFINTAGVGVVAGGVSLSPSLIEPGDRIIISGPIGSHGVAVMAERNGLSFEPPVVTDSQPLGALVQSMLAGEGAGGIRVMRDPTRGGVATTLKEFALESGLCVNIFEQALPVPAGVRGACDLLGLDPLYVANEGVLLAVVKPDMSDYFVGLMKAHGAAPHAAVIGEVTDTPKGAVILKTQIGGSRVVDMLQGEQLPRIC